MNGKEKHTLLTKIRNEVKSKHKDYLVFEDLWGISVVIYNVQCITNSLSDTIINLVDKSQFNYDILKEEQTCDDNGRPAWGIFFNRR